MTTLSRASSKALPVEYESAYHVIDQIRNEVNKVIVGQERMIERLLMGLFASIPYSFRHDRTKRSGCGHLLLEGVPGVAKTLAITTLSEAIQATFHRVQLTPDLLPADIVGTRIYDASAAIFKVEKGPIFTHILLADEINRATPKTQSALLEAMQERQVTIGEETFRLEDPFWVLATQNPVEQEGVYMLPEAQLDRFAMLVKVGYPTHEDEVKILSIPIELVEVKQVLHPRDVVRIRGLIAQTYVDPKIKEYTVRIGRATRHPEEHGLEALKPLITLGASPRSFQHLLALARCHAFLRGRYHVLPEDVKEIAHDALRHRVLLSIQAESEGVSVDEIISRILKNVSIPA
ncbi:MAG: MoxR family ATPase [Acidobacteria bacterium]|nr:MoxR family ATPase [Acidobacteriota bacterium]